MPCFRPVVLRHVVQFVLAAVCLPALLRAQAGPDQPTKQTLVDSIRNDAGTDDFSAATAGKVRSFLEDKTKPGRDRLEVKIAFEQARLKRATSLPAKGSSRPTPSTPRN